MESNAFCSYNQCCTYVDEYPKRGDLNTNLLGEGFDVQEKALKELVERISQNNYSFPLNDK